MRAGMVRMLRIAYAGGIALIAAAIVVQLYLAGYAVFAFSGLQPFDAHRALGDVIGIAVLIAAVLAFAARVPWRSRIVNLGLVVLFILQYVLAFATAQGIAALHVVNGVLIFAVTLYLLWEQRAALDLARAKAPNA